MTKCRQAWKKIQKKRRSAKQARYFPGGFAGCPAIALGVGLLILGLAGLVLPFLQGVLLIVAALAILRKDIPFVATLWDRYVAPLQERYRLWREARRRR